MTHLFSSFLKGKMAVEGALVDAAADTSLQLAILAALVFLATSFTNMSQVMVAGFGAAANNKLRLGLRKLRICMVVHRLLLSDSWLSSANWQCRIDKIERTTSRLLHWTDATRAHPDQVGEGVVVGWPLRSDLLPVGGCLRATC